jgi:hypothetical protein
MLLVPCEERYGAVAMTPQKFKDETLRALVDTMAAIARRQPTVMLFEDIHWADPTTLDVIDLLIHRVRNIPLLIVLTHRPEFSPRWSHYGHVAALTLSSTRSPSWTTRWPNWFNLGWHSSRGRRPMRSTPSSTPWCRTPLTTRCSGDAGRNYTAGSPG